MEVITTKSEFSNKASNFTQYIYKVARKIKSNYSLYLFTNYS